MVYGYGMWGNGPQFGGRRGSRRWGPFEISWDAGPDMFGARMRRRVFEGGELRLVLLKLIADQPRHGYDLIREIEEITRGVYVPSPGIVYPTLTLLEDMGLIAEKHSEGTRKQFSASDDGHRHLVERAEEVAALMARLSDMGAERDPASDHAPVRRAISNLRHVLAHKLIAGDRMPSDEQIRAIVALIDEAAQKIERLD